MFGETPQIAMVTKQNKQKHKRYSITLSSVQSDYLTQLACKAGVPPTSYVAQLVFQEISRQLQLGNIGCGNGGTTSPFGAFILSLVSDDGVDPAIVEVVCNDLHIPLSEMHNVLGI